MDDQILKKANQLNNLACKECTRGWLNDHDRLSDPSDDVINCFEKNLISLQLRDRLIEEIKEIEKEN